MERDLMFCTENCVPQMMNMAASRPVQSVSVCFQ